MNIIWYGQSCFEIVIKNRENEETKIIIDPFGKEIGLRVTKLEVDILLVSHQDSAHSNVKEVSGAPFLIEELGEYETKGVFIKGMRAFHDRSQGKERGTVVMYKIEAEGIKICHLSDIAQKELLSEQLEDIGEVDILMIPVGGGHTIGAREASMIISQIEPKIVIPMHYKIPKLKVEVPPEGLNEFLKVMGTEDIQPQKKLKVSLRDLLKEETQIVVLEP